MSPSIRIGPVGPQRRSVDDLQGRASAYAQRSCELGDAVLGVTETYTWRERWSNTTTAGWWPTGYDDRRL